MVGEDEVIYMPPPLSALPFITVKFSILVLELSPLPYMHWTVASPDMMVVVASPVTVHVSSYPPLKYVPLSRVIVDVSR